MDDLLPPNSTAAERGLALTISRISDVPLPLRDLWSPMLIADNLLPWLAWTFSVDVWRSSWTEEQQRDFIRGSVDVHRRKGTIGALKEALSGLHFDVQLLEWFNQAPAGDPYTFQLIMNADQIGISQAAMQGLFEVINRTKNLRSHMDDITIIQQVDAPTHVAVVAAVGNIITLPNYQWARLICRENHIVI